MDEFVELVGVRGKVAGGKPSKMSYGMFIELLLDFAFVDPELVKAELAEWQPVCRPRGFPGISDEEKAIRKEARRHEVMQRMREKAEKVDKRPPWKHQR